MLLLSYNMQTYTYSGPEPIYNNVYMAQLGVASRREADKLIDAGLVQINGKTATRGQKLNAGDTLSINKEAKEFSYFFYYKPRGEETGAHKGMPGLHPIGRLDKESEGLLVYSDDHRMVDALLNPDNKITKEYEVWTQERIFDEAEQKLKKGMRYEGVTYRAPKSVIIAPSRNKITITLTEGKKHEIRRMLAAVKLTVTRLKRTKINGIEAPTLKPGDFKKLKGSDLQNLKKLLK